MHVHEQPKCAYKKGQMLNEKLDIKEIEFLDIEKFLFLPAHIMAQKEVCIIFFLVTLMDSS
jgi:hypothetical protein